MASEIDPGGPMTPEFYKERALEMIAQAENATTEEARAQFLKLAEHWHRLAQTVELPNW